MRAVRLVGVVWQHAVIVLCLVLPEGDYLNHHLEHEVPPRLSSALSSQLSAHSFRRHLEEEDAVERISGWLTSQNVFGASKCGIN